MSFVASSLALASGEVSGNGLRVFTYTTDDDLDEVVGAGYFSDASSNCLRVNDAVLVFATGGPDDGALLIGRVTAIDGGDAATITAVPFPSLEFASVGEAEAGSEAGKAISPATCVAAINTFANYGVLSSRMRGVLAEHAVMGGDEPSGWQAMLLDEVLRRLDAAVGLSALDWLHIHAVQDATLARINLVNPGAQTLGVNGGVTFASFRGFTGNGVDGYLSLGAAPGSFGNYAQDDAHVGVWMLASAASNTNYAFAQGSGISRLHLNPRTAGNTASSRLNTETSSTVSSTDGTGHWLLTRGSSTGYSRYHNGVSLGDAVVSSVAVPVEETTFLRLTSNYSTGQIALDHGGVHRNATSAQVLRDVFDFYLSEVGAI